MVEIQPDIQYPHLATHWWLFHTGHYVSRIHMDADGAATVVVVPRGGGALAGKLWIIGRPKGPQNDVQYTTGVSTHYDPAGPNVDEFDYEAVWLMENDRLCVCLPPHM